MTIEKSMWIQYFSALLDDLDKETNNYIMRCKEWYGWHFPELSKIVSDNIAFCKTVERIGEFIFDRLFCSWWFMFSSFIPLGYRTNASNVDLSDILPAEIENQIKEAANISMGTEISEEDIANIRHLCSQVRWTRSFVCYVWIDSFYSIGYWNLWISRPTIRIFKKSNDGYCAEFNRLGWRISWCSIDCSCR